MEYPRKGDVSRVRKWCEEHVENDREFAHALDEGLWKEAEDFGANLHSCAHEKLSGLGVNLGGGGNYPLLYFLVRYLKPESVVETGIAAGYSSQSVLAAMNKNGLGTLYSSDFPYFRLENPEQYIGYLVNERLKDRWYVFLDGDERNIPSILEKCGQIDLLIYDSDKSYSGRARVMQDVAPNLGSTTVIVMDDIQDNYYFRDYVERGNLSFRVFEFEGKYLGVVGV